MSGVTKFKEEYVDKINEYLRECVSRDIENYKLPSIEGFSLFIGVSRDSIYKWESENPLFSDTLDKLRAVQKMELVDKGLTNKFNSTIAKLILSSNHGMVERRDYTTKDEKITTDIEELETKKKKINKQIEKYEQSNSGTTETREEEIGRNADQSI